MNNDTEEHLVTSVRERDTTTPGNKVLYGLVGATLFGVLCFLYGLVVVEVAPAVIVVAALLGFAAGAWLGKKVLNVFLDIIGSV